MSHNEDLMEAGAAASPVVSTGQGLVRGRAIRGGRSAGAVVGYQGIPYAAAPVGPLRWRPPQPPARWTGVRDAFEFGPDLPQSPNPRMRGPRASEDCLYLNVWTPAGAAPGSLPVMVWIHGGGFTGGSGSDVRSDGAIMAAEGVVVVSFNYRAGLFGFLAHRGAFAGVAARRLGQLRAARSVDRAGLGEEQHRGVRRRRGTNHGVRRVGGLGFDFAAAHVRAGARHVPAGDPAQSRRLPAAGIAGRCRTGGQRARRRHRGAAPTFRRGPARRRPRCCRPRSGASQPRACCGRSATVG